MPRKTVSTSNGVELSVRADNVGFVDLVITVSRDSDLSVTILAELTEEQAEALSAALLMKC